MKAIVLMLALGACVPVSAISRATAVPLATTAATFADFDAQLNAARTAKIASNAQLEQIARAHSADMETRSYFSHTSPDGGTLSSRMRAGGLGKCLMAENIAQGQKTASRVFETWMNSAGHRKNMLNPTYNSYGLARVGDSWTMVMYRPC